MFYLLLIYKIKNARERASPKRWCFFLAQKTLGEIKREFYVMARKPTGNPNGRPLTKNK